MSAIFSSTTDFFSSLDTTEKVAYTLLTPAALAPSSLPITNAISCACVVLLSGYFESYLKSLIKEYIEDINSLAKPISSIPYSMKAKHFSGGAEALEWSAKRDRDLMSLDLSQDLCRRLASLGLPTGYTLAWESFANTQSNPGPDTLKKLLAGLEIKGGWTAIADLSSRHGSLEIFLKSFMKMRNVCAHTGAHTTPPSGSDLLDYVDKFRCLAECIEMMFALRYQELTLI